jgi:hypothetical protein
MCRGLTVAAAVASAAVLSALLSACGASAGSHQAAPPAGLTTYGQITWNLDALLHDTFGKHPVYLNATGVIYRVNFSDHFISDADSSYWVYVFKTAHHSQFRLERPRRAPPHSTGATGGVGLLTVNGVYISCGPGKWLYEPWGQSIPEGPLFCSKP